jgi:hypothetical protein
LTLTKQARDAIARAVGRLRNLFEDEFSDQAKGRFGFHVDRQSGVKEPDAPGETEEARLLRPWVEPLSALSLSPSQATQRAELIGALLYLRREGLDGGEAVARLIREAAFTGVNRLLTVRVGEAVGVFPETTAKGRQSGSYREVTQDLFPLLAQEEDEGFWRYLQVAGDELGATVPLLFDRRLPVSAFVPSRTCVDQALEILNDPAVADAWAEPEALGWSYQFFNGDDVRVMRDASPQAPRNSRELAVRNQFFTPRYVVDWLVQNTLGRRLLQAGYDLHLPLLVGDPEERTPLALDDVRVLDPACGSGHFLLGCYDLLEEAWQVNGVGPADAAPRILRCLFGIEIDPRASQVAQAVLVLRARRGAPHVVGDPPVIVTARALPGAPDVRRGAFEGLSPNARDLAEELDEALADAATLGSLLRAEERMASALKRSLDRPKLAADVSEELLEAELLAVSEKIAGEADASPAARMFGADARDAVRFLRLCQQRYHAVLMNPPFGEPVPETRRYLEQAYGKSAADLYASFVERGVELLDASGYVGAITSRTGFFLTTFDEWRSRILVPRLTAALDLGVGVMHGAMVEAAAYVLSAGATRTTASFRRLLDEPDKAAAVYDAAGEVFVRAPGDFSYIPGAPIAYWLPPELLDLFRTVKRLNDVPGVDARRGAYTGDDFRYLRCWWEVPDSGPLHARSRWVNFAKGGEYSPYYAEIPLVVDWDHERRTFRDFYGRRGRASPIPENRDYFGRPGLTWSRRTQKGFCVRPVPAGCVFSDKGPTVFVDSDNEDDLNRLMAFLNSRVAAALLEAMVAFGSYEVGAVQRLPVVETPKEIGDTVRSLTQIRMRQAERHETSHHFVSPWGTRSLPAASPCELSERVDDCVSRALQLSGDVGPLSATYPTEWFATFAPSKTPSTHEQLSYLVGIAFGRWDPRIANGVADPRPVIGPYEPLPWPPRGMIQVPALERPHVVEAMHATGNGLLHDESGHSLDIVSSIERAVETLESGPHPPEVTIARDLADLRSHLRSRFFAEHLKQYSESRRSAPIYWYLAVPSKDWGVWAYVPAVSREMLFAIAGAARDRLRRLREHTRQLRNQAGDSGTRQDLERVERFDALAAEVEEFLETAEEVAQSGWTPDLNDGSVLCAAPLESLFADDGWRREIAKHRKKLEKGEYPWAAVQRDYFGGRR